MVLSRATPVDRTAKVFDDCSCSNQSSAAVISRATPSEGQYSADSFGHRPCEEWREKRKKKIPFFPDFYLLCLHMLCFFRPGGH